MSATIGEVISRLRKERSTIKPVEFCFVDWFVYEGEVRYIPYFEGRVYTYRYRLGMTYYISTKTPVPLQTLGERVGVDESEVIQEIWDLEVREVEDGIIRFERAKDNDRLKQREKQKEIALQLAPSIPYGPNQFELAMKEALKYME